jgi:hypothetical protein
MTIERRPVSAPPIHPMAALVTIVLDGVFTLPELDPLLIPIVSPIVGILGLAAVTLVQRYLAKDEWGPAVAKGLVMGIIAGVPYPVAGTAVGAPLLIWAGLHQWIKLPASGNNQLVDAAIKPSPRLENKEKE